MIEWKMTEKEEKEEVEQQFPQVRQERCSDDIITNFKYKY